MLYFAEMKNPHAVALGRLGGLRGGAAGGRARAAALSAKRRREIARAAVASRWGKAPELVRDLFPGYRLEDLRLDRDLDLVMLHVLGRGSAKHKAWLVRRFGDEAIRNWIVRSRGRGLTVDQMTGWVSPSTARRWQAQSPYARVWENR
jgi:hypothetical protein